MKNLHRNRRTYAETKCGQEGLHINTWGRNTETEMSPEAITLFCSMGLTDSEVALANCLIEGLEGQI